MFQKVQQAGRRETSLLPEVKTETEGEKGKLHRSGGPPRGKSKRGESVTSRRPLVDSMTKRSNWRANRTGKKDVLPN